jgi:hypothetical protein
MISESGLLDSGLKFSKAEAEHLVRRISDLNDYARHSFQLLVSWFTFFATVNYASMGWLAGSQRVTPGNVTPGKKMIVLIVVMFITQNLLGIAVCFVVKRQLSTANKKIMGLEQHVIGSPLRVVTELDNETPMPLTLYSWAIILMVFALVTIIGAWSLFPWAMVR